MSDIERFEYVFLGGGKGGKTLAMDLAKAGKSVALIEKGMIGGSCINVACIPSKTLIQSARNAHAAKMAGSASPGTDMRAVRSRVRTVVSEMVDINMKGFVAAGFDLLLGTGRFVAPRRIEVALNDGGTRTVEGTHVFINTGTRAAIPDIPGLHASEPMTHVEALDTSELPEKLIIVGGGYIGLEMAQAYHRLGSTVTILQEMPHVAHREDVDVSEAIEAAFEEDGIEIKLGVKAIRVEGRSGDRVNVTLSDGTTVSGTHILVAAGRTPVTADLGLDLAGVEIDGRGIIKVDERLATSALNTWAIGEVAGTPMFTHASYDDYRILKSQLSGGNRTTHDRIIPYAMFIEPELGRIGLNETEAKARGIAVRIAKLPMAAVPRARTNGAMRGFMKILIDANSDQILGFTMLGTNAGEVVTAVQMAMIAKLPYTAVRDSIIAHPLISEGLNILLLNVPAAG
ncbi:FAD-dependent oxidoreductase [Rhizobium lentis]|uniref:FAD-dependent oxidoreductase n=1 Tax=Rhizobium lentis TaxID=1138194 RepID=A0ABS7ICY6_9HYPH|nr:FAD-dependent oxidoreductase [Rhizobium lentis]MBX5041177.1 FAD-dependent oxidoreductase [Rhizobium lentis]MBX5051876.1 FAD-dependent oxidoreductase [Rhizobium lentis]MBX5071434.1 FAD-dependent oxidoreductase [Rhizobium lentis]MBX5088458.1 FAD-dependent oxidoreductase [Rhizobium lentis]MBX5108528.1 FAD-dependent oxidoreductase [Rhizobium lentis]